jgi:hypothetical protein
MSDDPASATTSATDTAENSAEPAPRKPLSPAAQRALAEAAERRAEIDRRAADLAAERHGRSGPEPVRYGDWEIKGRAIDF